MSDGFDELFRKEMEKRRVPVKEEEQEEFLKELEEHVNGEEDEEISEDIETVPMYPVDEEEEEEYHEEGKLKTFEEHNKKHLSYKEKLAERRQKQIEWKEQRKKERDRKRREQEIRTEKMHKEHPEMAKLKKQIEPPKKTMEPRKKPFSFGKKTEKNIEIKSKKPFSVNKAVTMITAIAVFFFVFMYSYVPEGSPEQQTTFGIMILMGMMLFLPAGMLLGWGILDPFMRCRLMRRTTRKNWGVVCFVSKGKRIISHVKDFDDTLIWVRNKCWVMKKNRIYEMDKYGEKISEGENIEPDEFVTITETVPVIFMDVDNMMPLSLHETQVEDIAPDELGPALKGWVDNQQAKLMFLKRTMETYYLILILTAMASAFFGYQNNQEITEMKEILVTLQNRISSLTPSSIIQIFSSIF